MRQGKVSNYHMALIFAGLYFHEFRQFGGILEIISTKLYETTPTEKE